MELNESASQKSWKDEISLRPWKEINQVLALRNQPQTFRLLQNLKMLLNKRSLSLLDLLQVYSLEREITDEPMPEKELSFVLSSLLPFVPLPSGSSCGVCSLLYQLRYLCLCFF